MANKRRFFNRKENDKLRKELSKELNIRSTKDSIYKWTTIKKLLKKQGYIIEDKVIIIDGKRTRVSHIRA